MADWFQPVATIGSALLQGKFGRDQARKQMRFQEDMSSTAYQRAMADMRKAGLNPILAGKLGGASTPTGAMAPTPDFSGATAKAFSNYNLKQLQNAQIEQATSNAKHAKYQADMLKMDIDGLKKSGMYPMLLKHTPFNYLGSKATMGFENLFSSIKQLLQARNNPDFKEGPWRPEDFKKEGFILRMPSKGRAYYYNPKTKEKIYLDK